MEMDWIITHAKQLPKYLQEVPHRYIAYSAISYVVYRFAFGKFRAFSWSSIAGPRKIPIIGNLLDLRNEGYNLHALLERYYAQYGQVFGFYYHDEPVLVVSEKELIEQVLVKQWAKFKSRKFVQEMPSPCPHMITMARGEEWKAERNLLSSAMSANSLRGMLPKVEAAMATLRNQLEEAAMSGKPIDISSLSQGYVLEVLMSITFDMDCPNQSDLSKQLVSLSNAFCTPPTWTHLVATLFGGSIVKRLPGAFKDKLQPFIDTALGIVAGRRQEGVDHADLLQLLLDAQKSIGIKDEVILAQGIVVLTAVLAMTSFVTTTCLYELASNERVQENIHDEILKETQYEDVYDHVTKGLHMIGACVQETERLHSPGFMLMRECNEDCKINGVNFRNGQTVFIPIRSIHRDPKLWNNPLEFIPERFTTEKGAKLDNYYPFGAGARSCVGERLSFVELKLALATIFSDFRLTLSYPQTLAVRSNLTVQAMMHVTEPVMVNVQKRE